ncbi:MAG: polymer-forming cytoskeletal protein [Alphaproteobacteria bacterium]
MIFKRKKSDGDGSSRDEQPASLLGTGTPMAKPFARPALPEGAARPVAMPAKTPAMPAPRVDLPRRVVDIPGVARRVERPTAPSESKKLIVGREIYLNGHISACERLVVEGTVEAELTDCRTIEVADSGTFKGSAQVESAEISGRVEGSLTVRERLLIHSSGRVTGTVHYGRIEIEQGGEINGDVKSLGAAATAAPARLVAAPGAPGAPGAVDPGMAPAAASFGEE